jgi:transcription initiation factor TFIIH subunit 2
MNQDNIQTQNIDEEENDNIFSWEKEIEKTWESIIETPEGLFVKELNEKKKRNIQPENKNIKKSIKRNIFLIIDFSKKILEMKDIKNSVMIVIIQNFIKDYFDQNPLSQLGIIITGNSIARKITELNNNLSNHLKYLTDLLEKIEKLEKLYDIFGGECSLQNSLEVAKSSLSYAPKYGSREILIIFGSLSTCDPGDIFVTIDQLTKENIQCSIIGFGAEVNICKTITEKTGGKYHVILNEEHFKEVIFSYNIPLPLTMKTEVSLIRIGFPQQESQSFSLCACHSQIRENGYLCPQCKSKICKLPTQCPICSLTLISSLQLAKSYHHLFPIPIFNELKINNKNNICFGCNQFILNYQYQCPNCKKNFCSNCDDYIHDLLYNCPGCELNNSIQMNSI